MKSKFYIAAVSAVFLAFAVNADNAMASNPSTVVDKNVKKEAELKDNKDTKDNKESKDTKDTKDSKDTKDIKEAPIVRTKEDVEKDIAEAIKKNDELNEKVSKTNASVIDAVSAFKNKKGISKKRLKAFNKKEPIIIEKTESLKKTIEELRNVGEKLSANDKSLDDVRKDLANSKTKNDKSLENELSLLEQGLALHIERGRILDSTLSVLGEILGLIP